MANIMLECKKCGEKFNFKDKIKAEDIKMDIVQAKALLNKRDALKEKINELKSKGKPLKSLVAEYNMLENTIVINSNWNNQEVYDFRGLDYPNICPNCKRMEEEYRKILYKKR